MTEPSGGEPSGGWTSPNERAPYPGAPVARPPYPGVPTGGQAGGVGGFGGTAGWGTPQGWGATPLKPGIIPLRPLSVGEILDGAISAIRAQPRAMLGLSALFAAAVQLLQLPLIWLALRSSLDETLAGGAASRTSTIGAAFSGAGSTAATVLGAVLGGLVSLILTGVLTVIVSRSVLGDRRTARQAWEQARPRLLTLLALAGLFAGIALGVLILALAPGLLLLAAGATAAAVVLLVVGSIAAVGAIVYAYVVFALAPPAAVLERQPARRALARSRALLRGSWWRGLGVIVLINVVAQILSSILALPFAAGFAATVLASGGDSGSPLVLLGLLLLTLGTILGMAITLPFTAAGTALLYIDMRMRREGLDIALAQAAGGPASPPYGTAPPPYGTVSPPSGFPGS